VLDAPLKILYMLPEALTIETYICLWETGLTGLTSGVNYTYQYWVGETTPIANSPHW
jgi:hypothetical protein